MSARHCIAAVLALGSLIAAPAQARDPGKEDGLVAGTLAFASPSSMAALLTWTLEIEPVEAAQGAAQKNQKKKPILLEARHDDLAGTQLFSEPLRAGTYRFKTLKGGLVKNTVDYPGPDATFTVEAGKVSYLGHIAVLPIETDGGSPRYGLRHEPADLERIRPALSAKTQAWPVREAAWTDDAPLRALYAETTKQAVGIGPVTRAPGGTLYAGSRFGGLLERSPRGAWKFASTGAALETLALHRLADGRLLAGGEAGWLAVGRFGSTFQPLPEPMHGRIVALGPLPNGDVYAVVSKSFKAYFLRSSPALDGWKAFGEINLKAEPKMLPHTLARRIQVHPTPKGLAVYVPLYTIALYDEAAGTWSQRELRDEIQHFWAWPDGTLHHTSANDDVETVKRSDDGGATWKDLYTLSVFGASLAYVAPTVAYKVMSDMYIRDGKREFKHRLMRSEDDGRSWKGFSGYADSSGDFHAVDAEAKTVITIIDDYLVFGPDTEKPWRQEYPAPKVEAKAKADDKAKADKGKSAAKAKPADVKPSGQ